MAIKKNHLILATIILAGFIVRLIKFGDTAVGTDVSAFSRLGKNLLESGSYSFGENYNMGVFFPPGYPICIAALNFLVNDLFVSAKLVSLVASVLTILLLYLIGRALYNEESGLFAAFAYAVHPVSIILGVYGNSDALFFCFFFLALYVFLISLEKDGYLSYLMLGLLAGLATNTRPEGIFICVLPLLKYFSIFGTKPMSASSHLAKIMIMVSVLVITLLPYMLFVGNYTGELALSGKSNIAVLLAELSHDREYHDIVNAPDNLYDKAAFTLTGDKTQLTGWNRGRQRSLLRDYIIKDPLGFIRGFTYKIILETEIVLKLLLPFLIPLLFLFFDGDIFRRRAVFIFVLFPVIYFIIYPVFIIIERQTFLIVLFPLILSSVGYVLSVPTLSRLAIPYGIAKNRAAIFIIENMKKIIIAIFIVSSLIYLKYSSFDKVPHPVEHAGAGNFIRTHFSSEYEKMNVMSAKPIVSFYSGARYTMLPYSNSKDVLEFAELYDVDIIVVDERLLSKWEYYNDLIKMNIEFDNVELVYEDTSGKMIRLFKIS